MILNRTPIPLAHITSYVKDEEQYKVTQDYVKKFCKLSKEDADKLMSEIRALNNLKIKEETLVKIADFCPQDAEDVSKIFTDVSLTEEETNAILAIVKKY